MHANTGISPNQKPHEVTLTQWDSPLGYWTWVVESIKQTTLAEKIQRKCWNSQNWWLKSLNPGSFMKKVTKSLFSFPVYWGVKSIAS